MRPSGNWHYPVTVSSPCHNGGTMPLQSYYSNVLSTAKQLVVLTTKFSVDLAAGKVTPIEGPRIVTTAGVGTGVLTITLPQIFRNIVGVYDYVVDPTIVGADFTITADVVSVGTKSQIQGTMTKQASGAPVPVTSGVFTVGLVIVAAA